MTNNIKVHVLNVLFLIKKDPDYFDMGRYHVWKWVPVKKGKLKLKNAISFPVIVITKTETADIDVRCADPEICCRHLIKPPANEFWLMAEGVHIMTLISTYPVEKTDEVYFDLIGYLNNSVLTID